MSSSKSNHPPTPCLSFPSPHDEDDSVCVCVCVCVCVYTCMCIHAETPLMKRQHFISVVPRGGSTPEHPKPLPFGFGMLVLFISINVSDILEMFSKLIMNLPCKGLAPRELQGELSLSLAAPGSFQSSGSLVESSRGSS